MSVDKNHSEQFERYLKGQMSSKEANAFEREILDDPFAQEALEGFEAHGSDSINDLTKLQERLRTEEKKPFSFLRVAAVVALLIVGSFSVYLFTDQIETDQLAMEEESVDEVIQKAPAPDTVLLPDSSKPASTSEEPAVAETQAKTFKKEEQEVVVEDKPAGKFDSTEQASGELLAEDVFAELEVDEIAEDESALEDRDNVLNTIQPPAAQVAVAEAKIESIKPSTDTLILDTEVVTTQSFVAQEQQASDDAARGASLSRAKRVQSPATPRSTTSRETISGIITDDTGEPLPGVNVVIKGTTTGVTTDMDGYFELQKTENQTIVVSYVGFESQEIAVGDRAYVDVVLGGATELQETVVVGYGVSNETRYSPAKSSIGTQGFKEYIEENLNYPEEGRANKIEGTVVLQLIINPIGRVTDIVVKKSLGFGCDEEAIRLIKDGPRWVAAKKDGKRVIDKLKVRVKFKLD